jgi:ubiquinone/menaquinone biosynthesis C-methylase UbiE
MWLKELFRRGQDRNQLWMGHDSITKAAFIMTKAQLYVPSGSRHLDIACGSGQILSAFNKICSKSIGVDLSEHCSAICRQQALSVIRANINENLPFKNETFDLVTLISTIEHVSYPNELLKEVNRILSPNGLIVIQIPNPYFPIDLHYFLPLYGYLPLFIQKIYRRLLAGGGYSINYNTIQISKGDVEKIFADYDQVYAQDIVYPVEVAPNWLRPFYSFYKTSLGRLFPTGHLFIYRKSNN